jgi:hypothetical protein
MSMIQSRIHECYQGPLCEQTNNFLEVMGGFDEDPMTREYGYYYSAPDPELVKECEHLSCLTIVYSPCEACFIEAMDAYHGEEPGIG